MLLFETKWETILCLGKLCRVFQLFCSSPSPPGIDEALGFTKFLYKSDLFTSQVRKYLLSIRISSSMMGPKKECDKLW